MGLALIFHIGKLLCSSKKRKKLEYLFLLIRDVSSISKKKEKGLLSFFNFISLLIDSNVAIAATKNHRFKNEFTSVHTWFAFSYLAVVRKDLRHVKLYTKLISLNFKESLTFKQHICGEEEYTSIEKKGRWHISQPWGM